MPIYNFSCKACGREAEVIETYTKSETPHLCECGNKMDKIFPTKMTFNLHYDPKKDLISWGNEGYSRTQRYREYDKRAKKNIFQVKGLKNENNSDNNK
jgi:putative FmdB family regulatory protein